MTTTTATTTKTALQHQWRRKKNEKQSGNHEKKWSENGPKRPEKDPFRFLKKKTRAQLPLMQNWVHAARTCVQTEVRSATKCQFILLRREKILLWKLRPETLKNDSKIQKNSKISETSKRFQLLPNAFECIPMGPKGSESLDKLAKTSKILRKLWKTSKHFAKKFTKTFFTA